MQPGKPHKFVKITPYCTVNKRISYELDRTNSQNPTGRREEEEEGGRKRGNIRNEFMSSSNMLHDFLCTNRLLILHSLHIEVKFATFCIEVKRDVEIFNFYTIRIDFSPGFKGVKSSTLQKAIASAVAG